jgi:hypothetical protein
VGRHEVYGEKASPLYEVSNPPNSRNEISVIKPTRWGQERKSKADVIRILQNPERLMICDGALKSNTCFEENFCKI